MKQIARVSLHLAAIGSVAASLTHIWAIFAGPDAYASLGAPPDVVASAEAGTLYAPTITSGIAIIIFGWALYAWSALRILPRLPLLRIGLIAIAAVLLVRGLVIIPLHIILPDELGAFAYWSSAICFALSMCFVFGLVFAWPQLRKI